MPGRVALEPEHPLTAARQLVHGGAAHDAETADDDIEMGHSSSRYYVAIQTDITAVKLVLALIILVAACDLTLARAVPLPRPRPVEAPTASVPDTTEPTQSEAPAPPSARRLPPLTGAGECGVDDVVRLEAVVLADKTRVAVTPPAIMRCSFAEAIVHWVREDVAPVVRSLDGATLKSIDNYASYDCRGRNRVVGAKLSEHGKANALDIRSLKLANGTVVGLTDASVPKEFREGLKKLTCARFNTVLGPGSDGYHEDHVHVDLAERRSGYRMCQWDVREPGEEPAVVAHVPLPRPRPSTTVKQ
jgi:extensin-like protein